MYHHRIEYTLAAALIVAFGLAAILLKNATIAPADVVSNGALKQFSETSNQHHLNTLRKSLQNGDR